jgi:hypothetical protein
MVQIELHLTEAEHAAAAHEAKCCGMSIEDFARWALTAAVVDADKPWMRYAGMVDSGKATPPDEIDRIAYERRP